jgi:hypothetical protein
MTPRAIGLVIGQPEYIDMNETLFRRARHDL